MRDITTSLIGFVYITEVKVLMGNKEDGYITLRWENTKCLSPP